MDRKDLDEILRLHKLWLSGSPDGIRADLSFADLSFADLSSADLSSANLRFANLRSANLRFADLSSANLRSANLSSADLSSADLSSANLRFADLSSANLSSADLSSANLSSANLRFADLSSANLHSADLSSANLRFANLRSAENFYLPMACPSDGAFVAWKKARIMPTEQWCIVKLMIYDDARRTSATRRKCRCDKAKVLAAYDMSGREINDAEVCSIRDKNFRYVVGETVTVPDFDENRWNECSTGIHFFITREEAELYNV